MLFASRDLGDETSQADLELLKFQSVDEWIQTAVDIEAEHGELVADAEVETDAEVVEKEVDLVGRRAQHETPEHGEESLEYVALGHVVRVGAR